MNAERRRWIAGLTLVCLAIALILWGLETALKRETVGGAGFPESHDGSRSLDLVFPDDDDGYIVETREVLGEEFLENDVRRAVEELVRGSTSGAHPLPANTRLLDVFFDRDAELVLNFSEELRKDHPGGSEAEVATLRCLAGTIAANFPAVQRIRLLIDGEALTTIAGHVDLGGALEVDDYR